MSEQKVEYSPQERFQHAVMKFAQRVENDGYVELDLDDPLARLADYLHKTQRDRFFAYVTSDDEGHYMVVIDKSPWAYLYTEQEIKKDQIPAECLV